MKHYVLAIVAALILVASLTMYKYLSPYLAETFGSAFDSFPSAVTKVIFGCVALLALLLIVVNVRWALKQRTE